MLLGCNATEQSFFEILNYKLSLSVSRGTKTLGLFVNNKTIFFPTHNRLTFLNFCMAYLVIVIQYILEIRFESRISRLIQSAVVQN